jgi:hypothetical protein
MRRAFITCCIVAAVLIGLSCIPGTTLEISVTEIDNGIIIQNVSNMDCLVFVNSPEGEQQFELVVGESVTVLGISQPIEVSAVSLS